MIRFAVYYSLVVRYGFGHIKFSFWLVEEVIGKPSTRFLCLVMYEAVRKKGVPGSGQNTIGWGVVEYG